MKRLYFNNCHHRYNHHSSKKGIGGVQKGTGGVGDENNEIDGKKA